MNTESDNKVQSWPTNFLDIELLMLTKFKAGGKQVEFLKSIGEIFYVIRFVHHFARDRGIRNNILNCT